jgi:hypothetical protein
MSFIPGSGPFTLHLPLQLLFQLHHNPLHLQNETDNGWPLLDLPLKEENQQLDLFLEEAKKIILNLFCDQAEGKDSNEVVEQLLEEIQICDQAEGKDSNEVVEQLLEEIQKRFPNNPEASLAIVFNLPSLLPHAQDLELFNKMLMHLFHRVFSRQEVTLSPWYKTLKSLIELNWIPISAIKNLLLIHVLLLECRKKNLDQKSTIRISTDKNGNHIQLHLKDLDVPLHLPTNSHLAFASLEGAFSTVKFHSEAAILLQDLFKPFYQGLATTLTPLKESQKASGEATAVFRDMAKTALSMIEIEPLKSIGFMVLCQCGSDLGDASNLRIASKALLELLKTENNSVQRIVYIRLFIQYVERTFPKDPLLSMDEKLNDLLHELANRLTSNEQALLETCKILSYSNNEEITKTILSAIEDLPEKSYIPFVNGMIRRYLSEPLPQPALALRVLGKLPEKKLTSYVELNSLYQKIYAQFNPPNLIANMMRLVKIANTLLEKKMPGDELGDISKYFDLIDTLMKEGFLSESQEILDKIKFAGADKKFPALVFQKHIDLANELIRIKLWEEGFDQCQKALTLFQITPADFGIDPGLLIKALFSITESKLPPEAKEIYLKLIPKAALNQITCPDAQLVLLSLRRNYASKINDDNFIESFQNIGSWLLKHIETYFQLSESKTDLKKKEKLSLYFHLSKNMRESSNERAALDKILGPHCFKCFIILENETLSDHFAEKQILTIGEELLNEPSEALKMCGFNLISQLRKGPSSLRLQKKIIGILPILLVCAFNENRTEEFVTELMGYFNYISPGFIDRKLWNKLKTVTSEDEIYYVFCEIFSTADSEVCFEAVFQTWQLLKTDKKALTKLLLENYQEKHPKCTLKILAKQAEQGNLHSDTIETSWNQILNSYKNLSTLPAVDELDNLAEIALGIIPKIKNSKNGFKDKLKFAADVCWLIESLMTADSIAKAVGLFDACEKLKLLSNIPKSNIDAWLKFCRILINSGNKFRAYKLCGELLAAKDTGKVIEWLLTFKQEDVDATIIELLLQSLKHTSGVESALRLAEFIVNFFPKDEKKQSLSIELRKALKDNVNLLISSVKNAFGETDHAAALFCRLFSFLPNLEIDISKKMSELSLWSFLFENKDNKDLQPIFNLLVKVTDKTKEISSDKARTYFSLANDFLVSNTDSAILCLERALTSLPLDYDINSNEINTITLCFTILLQQDLSKAFSILELLEKQQVCLEDSLWIKYWTDLLSAASKDQPMLAAKILIQKQKRFDSLTIIEELQPTVLTISQFLIGHNLIAANSQAITIANQYGISDSSFWLKTLTLISTISTGKAELLTSVCQQKIQFSGPKEECETCWLLLLQQLSELHILNILPSLLDFCTRAKGENIPELKLLEQLLSSLIVALGSPKLKFEVCQEIFKVFRTTYLVSVKKCKSYEDFNAIYNIHLKVTDARLALNKIEFFPDILTNLNDMPIKILPNLRKNYLNLICKSIKLFFSSGYSRTSDVGNELAKLIDTYWAELDPFLMIKFEGLNPSIDSLARVNFFLRDINISKEDTKEFENALESLLRWMFTNQQFGQFYGLIGKIKFSHLLPLNTLHSLYDENMEMLVRQHCSDGTLIDSEFQSDRFTSYIKLYLYRLPNNTSLRRTNRIVAMMIMYLLTENRFKETNMLAQLLTSLFEGLIGYESPNCKNLWEKSLKTNTQEWNQVTSCSTLKDDDNVDKYSSPAQAMLSDLFSKIVFPPSEQKTTKAASQKARNNSSFLKDFLNVFLEHLSLYRPKSEIEQYQHYAHLHLFMNLYTGLFEKDATIGYNIRNIFLAYSFPTYSLFSFQVLLCRSLYIKYQRDFDICQIPDDLVYILPLYLELDFLLPDTLRNKHKKNYGPLLIIITSPPSDESCNHVFISLDILKKYQNELFSDNSHNLTSCYTAIMKGFLKATTHQMITFLKPRLQLDTTGNEPNSDDEASFHAWKLFGISLAYIKDIKWLPNLLNPLMKLVIEAKDPDVIKNFMVLIAQIDQIHPTQNEILFECINNWLVYLVDSKEIVEYDRIVQSNFYKSLKFNCPEVLEEYLAPFSHTLQVLLESKSLIPPIEFLPPLDGNQIKIYSEGSILHLRDYFHKLCQLIINNLSPIFSPHNFLISSLDMPLIDANKGNIISSIFKIKLCELAMPLVTKGSAPERDNFFLFMSNIPTFGHLNASLFNLFKRWTTELLLAHHAEEANDIPHSTIVKTLFLNSPELSTAALQEEWNELLRSEKMIFFDELNPTSYSTIFFLTPMLESSGQPLYDLEAALPTNFALPRWQCFGKLLCFSQLITSEKSVNDICDLMLLYFRTIVSFAIPINEGYDLTNLREIKQSEIPIHLKICEEPKAAFLFLRNLLADIKNLPFMLDRTKNIIDLFNAILPLDYIIENHSEILCLEISEFFHKYIDISNNYDVEKKAPILNAFFNLIDNWLSRNVISSELIENRWQPNLVVEMMLEKIFYSSNRSLEAVFNNVMGILKRNAKKLIPDYSSTFQYYIMMKNGIDIKHSKKKSEIRIPLWKWAGKLLMESNLFLMTKEFNRLRQTMACEYTSLLVELSFKPDFNAERVEIYHHLRTLFDEIEKDTGVQFYREANAVLRNKLCKMERYSKVESKKY